VSSQNDEEPINQIKKALNELASMLMKRISEMHSKGMLNIVQKLSDIQTQTFQALLEIKKRRDYISEFMKLIKKIKTAPEDLLNLLSLPELPVTLSSGRTIVEGIVGYRSLGIETIDHYISKIDYENVKENENEEQLTTVSITSFIYRTPPFELTRCPYERGKDAEITGIIGARHVWLVKPENISEHSWRNIQSKVTNGRYKDVIVGSYDKVGSVLQLKTLRLVDITQRCLEIEIEKPVFFLKLGSTRLENELAGINNRDRLIEELRARERQASHVLGQRLGSWRIRLDYVYFCYKGLAISTDPYDLECPFKNCPIRREELCDGKRYWSATYYRRKPYPKVYPLRTVVPRPGGVLIYRERLPKNIIVFAAYDKRRVESIWYGIEVGTWFIRAKPTIRIYFDKNSRIGYSIPTSLLEISFDMDWLNNEIKKILESNDEIRKSIALKYVLFKSLQRTLDYEKLARAVSNILRGEEEAEIFKKYYVDKEMSDEFLTFARRLLLHSLEHMLAQYILFKLVGVDYNFILMRYFYKNAAKLFVIENARNGRLGIVDTVIKDVENKGLAAFLLEFIDWFETFLYEHDREFSKLSHERRIRASKLIDETIKRFDRDNKDKADRLKKIDEIVQNFSNELKSANLQLDVTLARTILLVSNRVSEDLIEELEDYFDDILEKHGFPLCWDGCNACVRLERYCGEGVYQILTTSKLLLKAFIDRLRNLMLSGIAESSRGVGKVVEPILQDARRSIDVSSPFISPKYARMLVDKSNRGVRVRVLTWIPRSGEADVEEYKYHVEALKILKDATSNNLEVRVVDYLHAKMYIVDGRIAITGSVNLTERGLYWNYEHVDIKLEPRQVMKTIEEFEKLWVSGKDLKHIDITSM